MNMKKYAESILVLCLLALALPASASSPPAGATGYHVIKKIPVGGEGGWDYAIVDAAGRRLYLSHATKVVVLDADKETAVGEIPDTNGVHGIAFAPAMGKGFTSNGRDNSVTIFDLKTLKVTGTVKTSQNPDAIIFDPASQRVFTLNHSRPEGTSTVIDAATGEVVKTIALKGTPEFAVADGTGKVFVNLEDTNEIIVIDSKKGEILNRWPLAPGEGPSGLAMDLKTRRLFSVCRNRKMIVMDADKGTVLADLPIGQGVDAAAFDPDSKYVFSSNGDGTLTIVHEDSASKFSVVENVPTQRGARTMALDLKTHKIFLPTAEYGPPPAATPERPNPRPSMVPGSFQVVVVGK